MIERTQALVAIDIGATSVKFEIFYQCGLKSMLDSPGRLGVAPADGQPYESLYSFMLKIAQAVLQKMAAIEGKYEYKQLIEIVSIGICWPGAIRGGKIASASGIFRYFESHVASNWARRTTVEQVRTLDLVKDFSRAWDNVGGNQSPTISVCNDGFAEGIGRLYTMPQDCRAAKWLVVKLGTGLAVSMIANGAVVPGPFEAGKLIEDVNPGPHDLGNIDSFPTGMSALRASGKAIPTMFRLLVPNSPENISSKEIALLSTQIGFPTDTTFAKFGLNYLLETQPEIASLPSRPKIEENHVVLDEADEMEWLINLNSVGVDLFQLLQSLGKRRLYEITRTKTQKDLQDQIQIVSKTAEKAIREAGGMLGDVIALLTYYLEPDGVILCGGVMSSPLVRKNLMKAAIEKLKDRYAINLENKQEVQQSFAAKPGVLWYENSEDEDKAFQGTAIHSLMTHYARKAT